MDPRRLLILACAGLGLSGCAVFRDARPVDPTAVVPRMVADVAPAPLDEPAQPPTGNADAPTIDVEADTAVPYTAPEPATDDRPAPSLPPSDRLESGMQIFAWSPGRVYPVRAAPLRVTTLTLGPGEVLVSKAAGDTVRWQIGEAASGEGAARRTHVLLKPLQRGLETNLVLTTNRRVYFLDLRSVGTDSFNAAVTWDAAAFEITATDVATWTEPARVPDPVVEPEGPLDARYRIEPQGRRARWTPSTVFNDGRRTFIAFNPDLQIDEAPALFVLAADGEAQMVNYRQAGGLFIVDRVFDRAELRLGDRRPQVVRIRRLGGSR